MSNLYRWPSKDASYQVLIHLARRFQRRRFFKKSTNHKEEWFVAAMFANGSGRNEQSNRTFHRCFTPSVGSFGQAVSEKILNNRPFKNNNCLWRPCLLMDRDKLRNRYRGPSVDATYQNSVHLGKRFQSSRFFRNQPIKNKNGLWRPCLLTDRK